MKNRKNRKLIGTFGDVNFLEHGGGIVYRDTSNQYQMVYFQSREWLSDEDNTPERWEVYQTDLDPAYINWANIVDVEKTSGLEPGTLSKMAFEAPEPMALCYLFNEVALYEGWSNFDYNFQLMTKTEINKMWGKWVR